MTMTNKDLYKKALNYSLRLLLRRNHTQYELEKKVIKAGFQEVSKEVMDQLIQWGYLDDSKYAEHYITTKMNMGIGKNKIFYDLIKKGILKENAQQAMDNFFNHRQELENLNEIATKKTINLLKRYSPNVIYNKLFRFLLGRGFAPSDVKSWLDSNLEAFLDNITNKL